MYTASSYSLHPGSRFKLSGSLKLLSSIWLVRFWTPNTWLVDLNRNFQFLFKSTNGIFLEFKIWPIRRLRNIFSDSMSSISASLALCSLLRKTSQQCQMQSFINWSIIITKVLFYNAKEKSAFRVYIYMSPEDNTTMLDFQSGILLYETPALLPCKKKYQSRCRYLLLQYPVLAMVNLILWIWQN